MDLLPGLSAFSVFLGIGAIGFLILIISLFFGEIFEHLDFGGLDHDLGHGGPGFFSTRVMSVFVTAFGGFGAIATHYDFTPLPASGIAFVGGVVLATPIFYFARFLYGQQATSEVRSQDLVGQIGRVIVAIPAGGVGQVRFRLGEELVDKVARGRGSQPFAENTSVVVEEVVGETIVVKER
jgi:membrane protein implicated in regulation of membrane protease activity